MTATSKPHELGEKDRRLVDLVTAALVDPNIHTDTRMRLCSEITRLLESSRSEWGPARGEAPAQATVAADGSHLPELLETVLTDPNLHTDTRMRLYHEIKLMLSGLR